MDHWTLPMPEDIVVQSQSILFAAALFVGCIIFDAQNGHEQLTQFKQPAPVATGAASRAPQAAPSAEDRRLFADAVRQYRAGAWSAAYGRFASLADHGDARSARIALAMLRDGPSLYKTHWDASNAQVQAWRQAAGVVPPQVVVSSD